jgi:hypothetical protein
MQATYTNQEYMIFRLFTTLHMGIENKLRGRQMSGHLLHLLLGQLILPGIENGPIPLHVCRSTPTPTSSEFTQVRERPTCMHLIRVNVVTVGPLAPLCGHQSCDACTLNVLADGIETVV